MCTACSAYVGLPVPCVTTKLPSRVLSVSSCVPQYVPVVTWLVLHAVTVSTVT